MTNSPTKLDQIKAKIKKLEDEYIEQLTKQKNSYELGMLEYKLLNDKETKPKSLIQLSKEDVVIKSIKDNPQFKEIIDNPNLKITGIQFGIEKEEIPITFKRGSKYLTNDIDTHEIVQETHRKNVEDLMKRKHKVQVLDSQGGFTFDE